jgi:hypothetical protein
MYSARVLAEIEHSLCMEGTGIAALLLVIAAFCKPGIPNRTSVLIELTIWLKVKIDGLLMLEIVITLTLNISNLADQDCHRPGLA